MSTYVSVQAVAASGNEIAVVRTRVVGGTTTHVYVEVVESFNPWTVEVILTRYRIDGADGSHLTCVEDGEVAIGDEDLKARLLQSAGRLPRYLAADLMRYLSKKLRAPGAWSLRAGGGDGVLCDPDLKVRGIPIAPGDGALASHVVAFVGGWRELVLFGDPRSGECGVGSRFDGLLHRFPRGFDHNCVWDWEHDQVFFVEKKPEDDFPRSVTAWNYAIGTVRKFDV